MHLRLYVVHTTPCQLRACPWPRARMRPGVKPVQLRGNRRPRARTPSGVDRVNCAHVFAQAACRHGRLLDSLTLDPDDHSLIDSALGAFAECLNPARPSLIHGDLWSGNALALTDGSVALIDPAPSYSDALADLAMMQLFGGFPDCFFESYLVESGLSLKPRRLAAYRLYHAMNHLLLFGEGYLQLVRSEARQVLSADP